MNWPDQNLPRRPSPAHGSPRAIDRESPVPYYHQLKEILRDRVHGGELKPGQQLEGEHALCEHYGVSRTVVRQALTDLQHEAVLERRKGRGTFVASTPISQSFVHSLNGLWDDIQAMGRTLRSDVRQLCVVPADADVADRLQLPMETPVVQIIRLRYVDDEPWVHAVSHVPQSVAPDLVEQDLTEQSLYHLLRDRYGQDVARSDRSVEARSAHPELADALQITSGEPVLTLTSVSFDADDVPFETFVAFHRADRSRFEISLRQSETSQPTRPVVRLV